MEQLDLIKITPDGKRMQEEKLRAQATRKAKDDDFFEMLSRSQSKRMDDQRCSIKVNPAGAPAVATGATRKPLVQQNSLFVDPTNLPGLKSPSSANPSAIGHGPLARSATTTQQPDDDFLDMLMRCQGSRLEEQRSSYRAPMSPWTQRRRHHRDPSQRLLFQGHHADRPDVELPSPMRTSSH